MIGTTLEKQRARNIKFYKRFEKAEDSSWTTYLEIPDAINAKAEVNLTIYGVAIYEEYIDEGSNQQRRDSFVIKYKWEISNENGDALE